MARKPTLNDAPNGEFNPDVANPDEVRAEFARRLYHRMRGRNWSQSDLARASGVEKSNISNYIRGNVLAGSKHLEQLARALDCTPEDLVPRAAINSVGAEAPPVEMKQLPTGEVMFRLNQRIPMGKALRIMAVLHENGDA